MTSEKSFIIWTEMNDEWKTTRYLKTKWIMSEKPFGI